MNIFFSRKNITNITRRVSYQWNEVGKTRNNNYKISGYSVTNLIADYKINNELALNLRLNNLFNRDYSLALNTFDNSGSIIKYQTPGSSFFINLRYEPK